MKTENRFMLCRTITMIVLIGGFIANSSANMLSNGSFEIEPAGTTVVSGSSMLVKDDSTFTGWQFVSIGLTPDFSVTSVTNASDGIVAMQLDLTNSGSLNSYYLDRETSLTPVEYGTNYLFSFDAAWISGSANLALIIEERAPGGSFLASQQFSYPISNGNYQQFIQEWTPSNPATELLYLRFTPDAPSGTSISLLLDHVHLIEMPAAYNAWRAVWFTPAQQADPAISGPEVYYDTDDFNNWEEYIGYTDPTDGQTVPTIQMQSTASNEYVLSWSSVSNRVYSVRGTPDLTQPFSALQTNIVWPQSSYTDQTAQVEGFYQLEINLPQCTLPIYSNTLGNAEIIGSSHVVPTYFFGTNDCLNEGADALLAMGSKNIKIWYSYGSGETPTNAYPWNSTWPTGVTSLVDWLDNTHYTELFDKPFKTFLMNVASYTHWNPYYWKDSITPAQINQEETEFYEFTKALLQKYAGTGKIFILQHHEGDWHTRGHTTASTPAAAGVHERMVKWLNARQRGVTRAREEVCAQDVFVYHAAEINVVVNSMNSGQENMVNEVLPFTELDLVSYSCYDSCLAIGNPQLLKDAVDYIKQNMPDSAAFGNDNVYLGEYGVPENEYSDGQIDWVMNNTVNTGLEKDCPYIIYWQLYDNEVVTPGTPLPVTSNSDVRGFWLIKPDGTKSRHYDYLKGIIEL